MTMTTPATTPADGELTLDANEVQFLAARLRRLFNHFKYPLPDWARDDKNLIGIAPTCIGAVLANLNRADEQQLAKGVLDDLASKGFCPPPQDETEAAEREHLGCAYCGTGIYADRATPSPGKADAEDAARYRRIRNGPYSDRHGDVYAMVFMPDGDTPIHGAKLDSIIDAALLAAAEAPNGDTKEQS